MAENPQETGAPGRPPFEPKKAQRRRVTILAGGGMAQEEIAIALGISPPTLRKYFADELAAGALQRRAEVLEAMFRMAKKGNVAAQKAYIAMSPGILVPTLPDEPITKEPKPPAVGKKEQAQADAVTAQVGTEWGDLLPSPGRTPTVQ